MENISSNPIKLTFENFNWTVDIKQLLALLDLTHTNNLLLDKDKTYSYLTMISSEINSDVTEGQFEFNPNTKRVSAFSPSSEGRKLNIDRAYQMLTDAITNNTNIVELPVDVIKPKIETSDVNSLLVEASLILPGQFPIEYIMLV